jgi:hypothetical protein
MHSGGQLMRPKSIILLLLILSTEPIFCEDLNQTNKMEPVLLTVCEALEKRLQYNDKLVAIVGVMTNTFEGSWLSDMGCGEPVKTQGFTWPNLIAIMVSPETIPDPPALDFIDQATLNLKIELVKGRNELRQFRGSPSDSGGTPDFSDRLVVASGRFETRPELRPSQRKNGQGDWGNGYGHLNASPAQLVIKEGSIRYF